MTKQPKVDLVYDLGDQALARLAICYAAYNLRESIPKSFKEWADEYTRLEIERVTSHMTIEELGVC